MFWKTASFAPPPGWAERASPRKRFKLIGTLLPASGFDCGHVMCLQDAPTFYRKSKLMHCHYCENCDGFMTSTSECMNKKKGSEKSELEEE